MTPAPAPSDDPAFAVAPFSVAPPPLPGVPLHTQIAAGAGEAAINIGINLPKNFAFPIYNLVLGVSPTLLGVALLIPRLWDAVIDPMMGSISDNTKSRFGRRRPYMLVGALLSAACIFLLCFIPRGLNESEWGRGVVSFAGFSAPRGDFLYAGYLMLTSIVFYTALTVFSVPYGALTMELTSDYRERTRVMSWRTFFTYLSGFLTAWLYAIAEWDIFKDAAGNKDVIRGSQAVGVLLLVVLLVVMLAPTLLVREPKHPPVAVSGGRRGPREKVGFWTEMKQTLREPAFLLIVAAYTIGFLGVIMVIGLGLYIAIYHTYAGDRGTASIVQGWSQTLAACAGIATVFVINRLSGRFEKKAMLVATLCCSVVGGLSSWLLYDPALPTWNLIAFLPGDARWPFHPLAFSTALIWPGLAGLLVMSNSMIADICDIDELRTGRRREGMYWAVFSWIQKSAISIALLFSGAILDWIGFQSGAAEQPEAVVTDMRLAFMIVVCGGAAIAAVLAAMIPIDRRRIAEVGRQLAAARTEAAH